MIYVTNTQMQEALEANSKGLADQDKALMARAAMEILEITRKYREPGQIALRMMAQLVIKSRPAPIKDLSKLSLPEREEQKTTTTK